MSSITAVIPAAGLGSRALPNSFASPKELAAVYSKPAIQWVVEEILSAGIEKIVIVVSKDKDAIQRYFEGSEDLEQAFLEAEKYDAADSLRQVREFGKHIVYVEQSEPLGLGHAVLQAERECDGPFLVANPDDLWLPGAKVIERVRNRFLSFAGQRGVIASQHVPKELISRYGCPEPAEAFAGDESYVHVMRIFEKPSVATAPSDLAVSGRWLLPNRAFGYLRSTQPGENGEIQLTSALELLAKEGALGTEVFGSGLYYDTGYPTGLTCASVAYAMQEKEAGDQVVDLVDRLRRY